MGGGGPRTNPLLRDKTILISAISIVESSNRQYINGWMDANKTSFTKIVNKWAHLYSSKIIFIDTEIRISHNFQMSPNIILINICQWFKN